MSPWTTVVFTSSPASHWGQPHLSLQPFVHFVDQDDALSVLHHLSPQELSWVVLHHLWRCVPPAASVDRVQLCSSCPVMLGCCGAAGDVQQKASVDVWTRGRIDPGASEGQTPNEDALMANIHLLIGHLSDWLISCLCTYARTFVANSNSFTPADLCLHSHPIIPWFHLAISLLA